jgi:hypothetical protein
LEVKGYNEIIIYVINTIMGMESYKDESGADAELLEAKVNNARQSVEQATVELDSADEHKKEIWQNRVYQRREELIRLEKELEDMGAGV